MKKIIKYVDILIITINFRLNNPIFKQYLYQKPKNKLYNNQLDYINLINKIIRYNNIYNIVSYIIFILKIDNNTVNLTILRKILSIYLCIMIIITNLSLLLKNYSIAGLVEY